MRSVIRRLVGRYLANWHSTRRHVDDMVSVGMLSVVKTVDTLTDSTLNGRGFMPVASQRACKAIEVMLYDAGSLSCPGKRTQETYAAKGLETPYLIGETDLSNVALEDTSSKDIQDLIDAEDALKVMADRLQLDANLLRPEFRGLTSDEAAAILGVHPTTVLRHRAKLRTLYKVDFGG